MFCNEAINRRNKFYAGNEDLLERFLHNKPTLTVVLGLSCCCCETPNLGWDWEDE